uniref:Uncharacterized protein n=1 Tax=Romanomermis culicivorax TaxID=13658 RepID=A0A915JDE7_ROMCU
MAIVVRSKTQIGNRAIEQSRSNVIDPEYELIDPNPNIFALFQQFNEEFFEGRVKNDKNMFLNRKFITYVYWISYP